MKIQQVLTCSTRQASLRDEIIGWGGEDPTLFVVGKPIGNTPGPCNNLYEKLWHPETIMEALAMGWKLLAPPTAVSYKNETRISIFHEWWLVREVER